MIRNNRQNGLHWPVRPVWPLIPFPVLHSVVFIPEQVFLGKLGLFTMADYYLVLMDSH